MNYAILLDIAAVAVVAVSVGVMAKKGVIKSLYKILSLALTIIAVILLSGPVKEMISAVGWDAKINDFVYSSLVTDDKIMQSSLGEENMNALPQFVTDSVENIADNTIVPAICDIVVSLVSALMIFLIAKLLIYLIFLLIEGVFKLPVFKSLNWLLGAVSGIISGLAIIYLVCGIASLNVSSSAQIRQIVDSTYLVKYFYDNNILMNIFLM